MRSETRLKVSAASEIAKRSDSPDKERSLTCPSVRLKYQQPVGLCPLRAGIRHTGHKMWGNFKQQSI